MCLPMFISATLSKPTRASQRADMTDEDIIKSVQEDGVQSDEDDTTATRDPALLMISQVMDVFRHCIRSQDNDAGGMQKCRCTIAWKEAEID